MSRSKRYLLSFTTLFYNKKGYVLMFNRHSKVSNLDQFPISFEPWSRYDSLIMRDLKMGTKVKQSTSVVYPLSTNYKNVFEGSSPTKIKDGSIYYLTDLSENLNNTKSTVYGDTTTPRSEQVSDFYTRLGETIKDTNAKITREALNSDRLKSTEMVGYGDTSEGELLKLLNLEGLNPDLTELLNLLPRQGYNQATELADILFQVGEKESASDRLLTIQYGEKFVDMAKANYVKIVLESLSGSLSSSDRIKVLSDMLGKFELESFKGVSLGNNDAVEKSISTTSTGLDHSTNEVGKRFSIYSGYIGKLSESVYINESDGTKDSLVSSTNYKIIKIDSHENNQSHSIKPAFLNDVIFGIAEANTRLNGNLSSSSYADGTYQITSVNLPDEANSSSILYASLKESERGKQYSYSSGSSVPPHNAKLRTEVENDTVSMLENGAGFRDTKVLSTEVETGSFEKDLDTSIVDIENFKSGRTKDVDIEYPTQSTGSDRSLNTEVVTTSQSFTAEHDHFVDIIRDSASYIGETLYNVSLNSHQSGGLRKLYELGMVPPFSPALPKEDNCIVELNSTDRLKLSEHVKDSLVHSNDTGNQNKAGLDVSVNLLDSADLDDRSLKATVEQLRAPDFQSMSQDVSILSESLGELAFRDISLEINSREDANTDIIQDTLVENLGYAGAVDKDKVSVLENCELSSSPLAQETEVLIESTDLPNSPEQSLDIRLLNEEQVDLLDSSESLVTHDFESGVYLPPQVGTLLDGVPTPKLLDESIETTPLASDMCLGVGNSFEASIQSSVSADFENLINTVCESPASARANGTIDLSLEFYDFGEDIGSLDIEIEQNEKGISNDTFNTAIENPESALTEKTSDTIIETINPSTKDGVLDTLIEGTDLVDTDKTTDLIVEDPNLSQKISRFKNVLISNGVGSDRADLVNDVLLTPNEKSSSVSTLEISVEGSSKATTEKTTDLLLEEGQQAAPSNTFSDVLIDNLDLTTRGRNRLIRITEEEQSYSAVERHLEISEEGAADSSNSTLIKIDEDIISEPHSHHKLLIEDEDESNKQVYRKISIQDNSLGHKNKVFDSTLDHDLDGTKERNYEITSNDEAETLRVVRNQPMDYIDDDNGIGLLPNDPPWEEKPEPKGKVWLMMGKNYPAWNLWNNKKTR